MTLIFKDPYERLLLTADGDAGDAAGGGSGDTPAQPTPTGTPPATPAPVTEDTIRTAIDQALQPYKTQIADLQTTNAILQGMVRGVAAGQAPSPATPAAPAAPALPSKDEFINNMNADPVGTLMNLIRDHVQPDINRRIDGVQTGVRQEQTARQQVTDAISADRNAAVEIATQWEEQSPERQLFDQYGEEELLKLCPAVILNGRKMPDPQVFRPGMLEQAALRAERRLAREGKLPRQPAPATGAGNGQRVVQFPRASRSSTGAPQGNEAITPKTIDDLVSMGKMTTDQAEAARRNSKRWQLSEDRFVANWLEAEKDNPNYGTGL